MTEFDEWIDRQAQTKKRHYIGSGNEGIFKYGAKLGREYSRAQYQHQVDCLADQLNHQIEKTKFWREKFLSTGGKIKPGECP